MTGTDINAPGKTERPPEIPRELETLSRHLDTLENRICCIEEKTKPVVTNNDPIKDTGIGNEPDIPTSCELATTIRSAHERLNYLTERITTLTRCIEL